MPDPITLFDFDGAGLDLEQPAPQELLALLDEKSAQGYITIWSSRLGLYDVNSIWQWLYAADDARHNQFRLNLQFAEPPGPKPTGGFVTEILFGEENVVLGYHLQFDFNSSDEVVITMPAGKYVITDAYLVNPDHTNSDPTQADIQTGVGQTGTYLGSLSPSFTTVDQINQINVDKINEGNLYVKMSTDAVAVKADMLFVGFRIPAA